MTRTERRVVRAAVALCKVGGGFCFKSDLKISDVNAAKRLEAAVTALAKAPNKR